MKILSRVPFRFSVAVPVLIVAGVLATLPYALSVDHAGILGLGAAAGVVLVAYLTGVVQRGETERLEELVERLANGTRDGVPAMKTIYGYRLARAVARLNRRWHERVDDFRIRLDIDDAIIEALTDPLFLVGRDRTVARANGAARRLFGEKLVGRDLAASVRQPEVLEAVDAVIGGGASRTVEYGLPVPVERVFEVAVRPFSKRAEQSVGGRMVVLTLHDTTAIRRSEQMRADFIANASHELRTPLSSLLGFIETLRGPARDDPEAGDRFLAIMHDQASRMTRLVQDLMSLSRIELDEHMAPDERVDVLDSLREVIESLELKAAARGIQVVVDAPAIVPEVIGDADQLTQVFQNLISNAIKYTKEGTVVTVSVAATDGQIVGFGASRPGGKPPRPGNQTLSVAVADRGEGISRIHLPRLTERFYRVDPARSRALGGTGLGLAIVKHIMNRHRGRLTIESEVGRGSIFTVYIPVAADEVEGAAADGGVGDPATLDASSAGMTGVNSRRRADRDGPGHADPDPDAGA